MLVSIIKVSLNNPRLTISVHKYLLNSHLLLWWSSVLLLPNYLSWLLYYLLHLFIWLNIIFIRIWAMITALFLLLLSTYRRMFIKYHMWKFLVAFIAFFGSCITLVFCVALVNWKTDRLVAKLTVDNGVIFLHESGSSFLRLLESSLHC